MKVLITGTSSGVGKAAALKFLHEGFNVIGIDTKPATLEEGPWHYCNFAPASYSHIIADVSKPEQLPDISDFDIIVNNAGIVTPQKDAIAVNQEGYINILEKYADISVSPDLKAILQVGSTASYKGYDNIRYCSSQGARDALTKWAANNYGNDPRHVIVNSLNLDGIVPYDPVTGEGTTLEPELYAHPELLEEIASLSVLKRLTTVKQIAEWVYFLTAVNNSMTGQILSIDGELTGAFKFIKYPGWED